MMKKTTKYALLAASPFCGRSVGSAQYVNGDLLIDSRRMTSDFIYDLVRSLRSPGSNWNVGANRGRAFGVVGSQQTGRHIYATSFDSVNENSYDPTGLWPNARADITTIGPRLTLAVAHH